ncbi:hypothetical protein SS50377_20593 [Spironucleus salmonicida]|uniref:Uncharacterized protein n=2 Tax=Spironucleus salmonicida TaxID=348837 RepID=A0A9P8LZG5_9EUKA|nr:hypothetical protein SS50377_20582 [Spironucleus salmonicida]KAH0577242.1 hypothetical protein SS50377_20593 [Spironucleus salmonicida]
MLSLPAIVSDHNETFPGHITLTNNEMIVQREARILTVLAEDVRPTLTSLLAHDTDGQVVECLLDRQNMLKYRVFAAQNQ